MTSRFGEVWRYRDLLWLLIRRDIVAFYKQTLLGPLWFAIQPLLTAAVYIFVFGQIAQLSTDGLPQPVFYLAGISLWNYFADCFNRTAVVLRENAALFGKVYFPRLIVPMSIVVSNLFRFGIQFTLFLLVAGYYFMRGQISPNAAVLVLPWVVLNMAILGLAAGLLFSALTTKYRDLVFLLQFGVQLLMYASPVIYPLSEVPLAAKSLLAVNPLVPLFEAIRYGFLGTGSFDIFAMIYSSVFSAVLLGVSLIVFTRVEQTFMDTV